MSKPTTLVWTKMNGDTWQAKEAGKVVGHVRKRADGSHEAETTRKRLSTLRGFDGLADAKQELQDAVDLEGLK